MTETKIERIKNELKKAHVTSYGLMKQEARFLHKIIENDEHIEAVVYGLYGEKVSIESSSGMLIATNKRVIFIDRKPLYVDIDEFGYGIVLGINVNHAPFFSSIVLHTSEEEYYFRNVNKNCAKHFEKTIKDRVLGKNKLMKKQPLTSPVESTRISTVNLSTEAEKFLKNNHVGVLSTSDDQGDINAAAIYYLIDGENRIYFITKTSTAKFHNLSLRSVVDLTIFNEETMSTAQIKGICDQIEDADLKNHIFEGITRPRVSTKGVLHSVPVTKMQHGAYAVFCLTMTECKYRDYRDKK